MERVRPFTEDDIPQVANLHWRIFRPHETPSQQVQERYRWYFQRLFLNNPWCDANLPSLVYQEEQGNIVGFLGVMPRRMSIKGQPIQAAVSSQFVVDPDRRATLAAIQLAKTFLAGPQQLSMTDEAGDATRKLWECAGGNTAFLCSLSWLCFLRPCRFLLSRMRKRRLLTPVAVAATPLCRLADAVAVRMLGSPFRRAKPPVSGDELTPEVLLKCLSEFSREWAVRPEYDERSLTWLLDILAQREGYGPLKTVAVRSAAGEIIGWYLYHANRGGVGEVLQVIAKPSSVREVLNHLFYHAWRCGVAALTGRLEPRFLQEFRENSCVFSHRGQWVLVHSRNADVVNAIHSGDAFLTRLEGEWCLRFS